MTSSLRSTSSFEVQRLSIESLRLDPRNPRLDFGSGEEPTQEQILELLWREFSVDEIAISIAANGYIPYEPMVAELASDGTYVVIEGNRRLAAVRLLRSSALRASVGATDLPAISSDAAEALDELPVVIQERSATWEYVGFKHVNGAQPWASYSKARYIAWVHDELGMSLEQIAMSIGDKHATVRRLYRAFEVLAQAEREQLFDVDDRWKRHFSFSHLYTGLDYRGISSFVGVAPDKGFRPSPIAASQLPQLGELMLWLYGSKSKETEPVVQTQNPDLRILDEVLQSADGVAALRRKIPLGVSRDIARGDDRVFREALISAKSQLQEARGRFLTGYAGEEDLLKTAREIRDLSRDLHRQMSDWEEGSASNGG